MSEHDVVVVGDGALGLFTAIQLLQLDSSQKVALVGDALRVGSASGAAGAMLGFLGEVTAQTLSTPAGRAKFELSLAAHELWTGWIGQLESHSPTALLKAERTLLIQNAQGGESDSENFRAISAAAAEYELAEPRLTLEFPQIQSSTTQRPLVGLEIDSEGAVDAGAVLGALESEFLERGGTRVQMMVDQILRRPNGGWRVHGAGISLTAAKVVVAAGAMTSDILAQSDISGIQPIVSGSGVAMLTRRVVGHGFDSVVRSVTRAGSCGLHLVPLGGGLEYIGATNVIFGSPELNPHLGVTHFLADCAMNQIDRGLALSRIEKVAVGNRPVSLDTFPLLGLHREGLWVLCGTYRDGFHAAPEIGRLAAREILLDTTEFPEVLRPGRPLVSHGTVEESITRFGEQQLASAFETGYSPATFGSESDLGESFTQKASDLYEDLQIDFGLASDILSFLCLSNKGPEDIAIATAAIREKR